VTPRGQEGFTLIESLVAFAILSIAIIMSFRIFGEGLQRVNRAEEVKAELEAAHQEMQRLVVQADLPEGERIESSDGHRWRIVTRRHGSLMSMTSTTDDLLRVQLFPADPARTAPSAPILEAVVTAKKIAP
jgi:prepilin-type N-terminal cleavage/methylation domain-containing protein